MDEWKLIKTTPFIKGLIPRGNVTRVRYLFDDEEMRLLSALPEWLTPIVIISRETGLRRSNVVNLTWSQVNLFSKIITIEVGMKNGDPIGIPMTDNVFETLNRLSKIRMVGSDYVFGKGGLPFHPDWITKSFQKAVKKAGIKNLRFHDMRHDFCSRLVQRGVDLHVVAALAGHRDIKVTSRYAHLNPENLRSAVETLNSGYNLATVREKRISNNQ